MVSMGTGSGTVPRRSTPFPHDRAQFRAALKAAAPAVFAVIPGDVWGRKWVSFCKHYGHGNDAVLTYLSRYVFRTAISNARILGMDQTHVTFRWKDRGVDALCIVRLPGVEFLRHLLQHVLPRLSQGPILRALAPLEARPVQSCLGALDPGYAGRRRATAEDIQPLGGVERADGTGRSSCRRGGGSRRGPAAMSPLRQLPDALPWRVSSFRRAVTLTGR